MHSFENSENSENYQEANLLVQSEHANQAGLVDKKSEHFRAEKPLYKLWLERAWQFVIAQKTLFEAFWVAVSLHIVMFPVLWFIGWALPWPKPPVVTTIIEYDLQAWLKNGKPKRVFEFRDPALND